RRVRGVRERAGTVGAAFGAPLRADARGRPASRPRPPLDARSPAWAGRRRGGWGRRSSGVAAAGGGRSPPRPAAARGGRAVARGGNPLARRPVVAGGGTHTGGRFGS